MHIMSDRWCIGFAEQGYDVRVWGNIASCDALPVVYMPVIADEGHEIWRRTMSDACPSYVLVEIAVDWHRDMSPWAGPALRRRGEPFAGGADAFLEVLTHGILPRVERMLSAPPLYRALVGYSLAGLFAMYSLYRTDRFARIGSMSGSLWFWDFVRFAADTPILAHPERVYLSLGDAEHLSKDPTLAAVRDCTLAVIEHLSACGIATTMTYNEGNHFTDPEGRMALGIQALLR